MSKLKVAALDLGSNTFLNLIIDVHSDDKKNIYLGKTYTDEVQVVRLGQGLDKSKLFHPDALLRAKNCLELFSKTIRTHQPDKILAMATSAARDAKNKEDFFKIAKSINIPLEIISGESEAQITYQGATSGLNLTTPKKLLVLDIGGGSTEFIAGEGDKLIFGKSLDIGCVRLTERFITAQPTPEKEIEDLVNHIEHELEQLVSENLAFQQKPNEIVAVAGTPTSLAAAELGYFDVSKIDNYQLTLARLESWLLRLKNSTVAEKINMGIPEGRADVILVGVIILIQTLKVFGLNQICVSTRGVRYGVALEMGRRFFIRN